MPGAGSGAGFRFILPPMTSVADALRGRTREHVEALPVRDRIALALALGDDDLALFARAAGLDRREALERLRAARRRGRLASGCGEAG